MTIIEDGTGQGYSAKVDDHGRLNVAANMIDHKQHHSLYHKNLFFAKFDCILGGTSETNIAFFKNIDPTKDFQIYDLKISSDSNVKIGYKFGDDYSSGGNVITPLNTNRGSGISLPSTVATIYEGGASANLSLTTTNRKEFQKRWLEANDSKNDRHEGSIVITNGEGLTVTATGALNDEISITMTLSYHDAGTVL